MDIVMRLVLLVQHGRRDVRNISPGITFAGNVDLEVLDAKGILPIQEEFDKILGDLFLCRRRRRSCRVTSANRLFDPRFPS